MSLSKESTANGGVGQTTLSPRRISRSIFRYVTATAFFACISFPAFCALGALSLVLFRAEGPQTILSKTDYGRDHVLTRKTSVAVKLDKGGGARIRTEELYLYGTFSAYIKCPSGNTTGLASTFYTSSETFPAKGYNDEIDLEFLGDKPDVIQTNFYVDEVGHHEDFYSLGFDCSSAFHKYTIHWTSSSIQWFVDDLLVRTVTNDGSSPYPSKPSYLYASIWDASGVDQGFWVGNATFADAPYYFQLQDVSVSESSSQDPRLPSTVGPPAKDAEGQKLVN